MMLIACDCLNILIRFNDDDKEVVGPLNINMIEKSGCVAQDLLKCVPLETDIKILKLFKIRRCGSILVNHCLYCGNDIFASHDNNSPEIVFDKKWMINSDDLNTKLRSSNFSPFYQILIDYSELDPDFKIDDGFDEKLSTEARMWLEDQTSMTEKRIEIYTNEQFAELEKLKKRIYQDHDIIKKKLLSYHSIKSESNSTVKLNKENMTNSTAVSTDDLKNEKNIEFPIYESDEVFFLDDVDKKHSSSGYYVDLLPEEPEVQNRINDTEYIPNAALMSRSLPLAVPQFISDKDDQSVSPDVPVDIAASIKALARSLHGDKIFGDLPPPRFSAL